ncbi:Fis family transcriptional regulator [Lysinibacillus contaminans]|uniref:HTH-type transcriptional regulatory protein TyrR n=1 Tax=Lysinibacillus contaminans TaxID=1293441 RepID=A0ABR5K5Z6_9BACI|nr:Fis family transcriptional regulator [Lysinibacillus contaminans]
MIHRSNVFLQHLLKYSFDEIFIADTEGRILYASENSKDFFGMKSEEIVHQNAFDLEAKGILSPSVICKVLKTGKVEMVIQNSIMGRKLVVTGFPIVEFSAMVGVISFSRDITELDYLKRTNENVAAQIRLYEQEIEALKKEQSVTESSISGKMRDVFAVVEKVCDLDVSVLLEGDSGVGKNYIARKIHMLSNRNREPFIEVNCGAIPEALIESELFGYVEGAFTGAKKGGKLGYFEAAGKGTILLDEIAELPHNLQVKLLSVLQNRAIQRVGSNGQIDIKCRIIYATNKDLHQLVLEKKFREDLYYRINVIKIKVPPLRERREEIPVLVNAITEELNNKHHLKKVLSTNLISWMYLQEWPGNIRELRNYIERILITSNKDLVDIEVDENIVTSNEEPKLGDLLEKVEGDYIKMMYKKYPSSIKLAKKLGISQSTANRKINQYVNE